MALAADQHARLGSHCTQARLDASVMDTSPSSVVFTSCLQPLGFAVNFLGFIVALPGMIAALVLLPAKSLQRSTQA